VYTLCQTVVQDGPEEHGRVSLDVQSPFSSQNIQLLPTAASDSSIDQQFRFLPNYLVFCYNSFNV